MRSVVGWPIGAVGVAFASRPLTHAHAEPVCSSAQGTSVDATARRGEAFRPKHVQGPCKGASIRFQHSAE